MLHLLDVFASDCAQSVGSTRLSMVTTDERIKNVCWNSLKSFTENIFVQMRTLLEVVSYRSDVGAIIWLFWI